MIPTMQQDLRRAHPRVDCFGVALIRSAGQEISCLTRNLSEGGMLLCPRRRGEVQRHFRVQFVLPSGAAWLDLEARLAREVKEGPQPSWGIQFTNLSDDNREVLRQFVDAAEVSDEATALELLLVRPFESLRLGQTDS